jgi:uncharacterized Zn-binding protein involved in type VI secretion
MGKPAARLEDLVLQEAPHCHAPMHPPPPLPPSGVAAPHPGVPLPILGPGAPTVLIGKKAAACMSDMTEICEMEECVPGGPGIIMQASATVFIGGRPAARVGDMTMHPACVAPIPGPTGMIMPPGCPTVLIGG